MKIKQISALLFFALITVLSAHAQTGWLSQKLDERISVKMPAAPKLVNTNNINIYITKDRDSVGYIANIVDFMAVANVDSTALAPIKDTQEFADQLKNGIGQSLKTYTLGDVTIGKWRTFTTYSAEGPSTDQKSKIYIYLVLIGSKLCSMSCMIPDKVVTKNKDLFFGSVEVTR